jgi:hypothetical protein
MRVSITQQGQDWSTPSLADEPFAAAIAALPPMADERRALVGERLLALAYAHRHEMVDFSFGDKEVVWCSNGESEQLAMGYDGEEPSLTLLDPTGEPVAEWAGEDTWALLSLGRLAGRERNDSSVDLSPLDEVYLAQRDV